MSSKLERLEKANELIDLIKGKGRRFFENVNGHNSKFLIKDNGYIYFIEDYRGKEICVRGKWINDSNFCHGGGLNEFIRSLANYIRGSKPVDRNWLGQHWGYGKEMEQIRDKAEEIGFVA